MSSGGFLEKVFSLSENNPDPYEEFFSHEHTTFVKRKIRNYTFFSSIGGRFPSVEFSLLRDGVSLDIIAELPVCVKRSECSEVLMGLMQINEELDDDCCFDVDIISGQIRFRMHTLAPNKEGELRELIDECESILRTNSEVLMDILCRVIASGDAAQKIVFRKGRWAKGDGEATYTYDELKEALKTAEKQVIVLEGPSGCGKSTLVRELIDESERKSHILPVDQFLSCIEPEPSDSSLEDLETALRTYDLICIEDVDWALRASSLQAEAGHMISKLAKNALVILDGVSCTEKNPTLLEMTQPTIYRFTEAPK